MADNKNAQKLFTEFPAVSTQEWEEKIHKDLKGADYEKRLVWRTLEGIKVKPYYRKEDLDNLSYLDADPGQFPYIRGTESSHDWFIRQDIEVSDLKKANAKALDIMMRGVDSLGFIIKNGDILSYSDFQSLFHEIYLPGIEVNFEIESGSKNVMSHLIEFVKSKQWEAKDIRGSINYDPITKLNLTGIPCKEEGKAFDKIAELIKLSSSLPKFRIIGINAYNYHNAAASAVQELGFALSHAAEYLDELTERDFSIDEIASKISFRFAVGSNYFMEIAKFRAAKLLWAKIIEAYQPECKDSAKMYIHALTSKWNKTAYDPYVNMLRTTTESMSSILGGIDSLTVLPFDQSFRKPSEFSERIARNTQIILKEESYFNKITDPAAGSYYIENLTHSIAEESWKIFTRLEENDGYIASFYDGIIQNEIAEIAQKRDMNLAMRKEILLGTNQFPNTEEKIKDHIDLKIAKSSFADSSLAQAQPLNPYRGAEAFEALRLKTENALVKPKVFLLTYGNLSMRKARAGFASNFFACAGFEVIDNLGFETIEAGVEAAAKASANIIVICSSDEEYPEIAPLAHDLIKGKAITVIAGYPKDCMDDLKSKGISNFIHIKSNVLETLRGFQTQLGI